MILFCLRRGVYYRIIIVCMSVYKNNHFQHQHQHGQTNQDEPRKVHICRNCGMNGHVYKSCPQPIVSFGLICYRNIRDAPEYLMIQRKDSLSFMEFIRGKYDPNDVPYITKLLGHMTTIERNMLITKSFEDLWNHVWFQKSIQRHTVDFEEANKKFKDIQKGVEIKDKNGINCKFSLGSIIKDTTTPFTEPEWGFPKGRRHLRETDVSCAIREFCEETGFNISDVKICDTIKPFEEVFYGTNAVLYRHVYFIAELITNCEREIIIDPTNINQAREVQKVSWFPFQEVLEHIRTHNLERKELFTCANTAIISLCQKKKLKY